MVSDPADQPAKPDAPEPRPPLARSSKKRFLAFRADHRQGLDHTPHRGDDARDKHKPKADKQTRRRYLRQYRQWLRPYAWTLGFLLLLALVEVALASVKPYISSQIIDDAVGSKTLDEAGKIARLSFWGWMLIIATLATVLLESLRSWRMTLFNASLIFRVRQRLHDHLLHLPLSELSAMKSGGIVSRLSGDVDSAMGLVQSALISPAVATIQAIVAVVILFTWNWRLALATTMVMPVLVLIHLLYVRRIRPVYRSIRDDRAAVDGRVSETFGGIRVVRGFRREIREEHDYAVGHHTAIRKNIFAQLMQMAVGAGWGVIMPGVSTVILWYGGYQVIRGEAGIGQLFAFQWYIFLLLGPILRIVSAMNQTQSSLAAMERIFDILEKPRDKPDAPDAVEAPAAVGEIRFDHVSFEYNPGKPVIQDFNLTVPGGSVVAIVGPSGAGKTTLTDLVARFHDPTAGQITLNGVDLRQIKLASFRGMLGIVQQDVFLFDGTVRENIAYGRRGVGPEQVLDAARRANADEFIRELPQGYDTLIGERGVKLSGGQRQRLAIARALLADPQILILDEATSNLDTHSEQLIQAALSELYAHRTTFVIAHRLSTVTHADLIVVMDRGRVVELGDHATLMAGSGLYHQMVQRQKESFGELNTDAAAVDFKG